MKTETTNASHPKRILITGAAGFIGSHLTERMLAREHHVIGIDNMITGTWRNLAPFLDHPRFRFIEHDVVRPLRVNGPLDWILHFASPASPIQYQRHPIDTLRSNAEGTLHLLDLAHARHGRLLLASTSEVYGDPDEHPQNEDYWGHVNPIGPRSMYDEAKRYAEAMVTTYHRMYDLPVRIIRIFNTYGPRMREDDGRVVVNFIHQAITRHPLTVYGDGSQTRSFQYIDDLLDAIERVMLVDYARPINIGNPEEYSMIQLAAMIKTLTGSESPIVFQPLPEDDPRQRRPDITLAGCLLGWRPRVSLRDGLRSTIRFFRHELDEPRAAGAPAEGVAAAEVAAASRPGTPEPGSAGSPPETNGTPAVTELASRGSGS
jgi:nucleoside-diphosphate-sugar epimerase